MKKITVIITLLSLCAFGSIRAQVAGTPYLFGGAAGGGVAPCDISSSTMGQNFYLTFSSNTSQLPALAELTLMVKIVAEDTATVNLGFTANSNLNTGFTVNAGQTYDYILNPNERAAVYSALYAGTTTSTNHRPNTETSNRSLHITSSAPVSVYAFNGYARTSDATIILPVEALGTDYYRLSYESQRRALDGFGSRLGDTHTIIATSPGTTAVNINGTNYGVNPNANVNVNVNLTQGQVYHYIALETDYTGSHVTSNQPIAYFTTNNGVRIPFDRQWTDIIFEQLMPVDRWGTEFLIPNAQQNTVDTRLMNNRIRVVASQTTNVTFRGATRAGGQNIGSGGTLNAGQFVELEIATTETYCHISATNPVGVAAYMVGDGDPVPGGSESVIRGDPAMAWIPSVEQMIEHVTVSPFMINATINNNVTWFASAVAQHRIVVIAKTATKAETKINGAAITSGWTDDAGSGYSFYTKSDFNYNNDKGRAFKIENPNGIIVLGYGMADDEGYYYNAGSGACAVN